MTTLRETLRRELSGRFGVRRPFDDDTQLFSSGLLDSMSVIDLVSVVEQEIQRQVAPEDITLENFDSVSSIVAYATRLCAPVGAA